MQKLPDLGLTAAIAAVTLLAAKPAWALVAVPAPETGGLIALAVIGAIVVAKIWRRR